MSLWIDKKYLDMAGMYLNMFAWESETVATCRCPYCGDSKKNKYKKRGYFMVKDDQISFYCHNCSESKSLYWFLFDNTDLARQYSMESYQDGQSLNAWDVKPKAKEELDLGSIFRALSAQDIFIKNGATKLVTMAGSPVEDYCKKRKIPPSAYNGFYYVKNFRAFASNFSDSFDADKFKHPRLIIPFYGEDSEAIGFSARAFFDEQPKYIMQKINGYEGRLIYGLDKVEKHKNIVVVEGPIDSLFVPNCIANCNAALHTNPHGDILVFDNQPRNAEVVANMEAAVESGKHVTIWPARFTWKDINESIVKGGLTPADIKVIIDNNTYSGLELRMKFSNWRMV